MASEYEPLSTKGDEGSKDEPRGRGFWYFQPKVEEYYISTGSQIFVALLIVLNFFMQIAQREIVPSMSYLFNENSDEAPVSLHYEQYFTDEQAQSIFSMSVVIFNYVFLIELLINLYGRWPAERCSCGWFSDPWNVFDFIVVSLGVIDLMHIDLPGPLKMIRMLRAFRIFRLFGRVEALKKIINSLFRAAGGMGNGIMLVLVVTCIYSSLAVDLYGDLYCSKEFDDFPKDLRFTARDRCFGKEYYGNFLLALYTMFQILTGESWSEAAVRPILHYHCVGGDAFECGGCYFFFISYICITAVVLLNVFAVCLLDAYGGPDVPEATEGDATADTANPDDVQLEKTGGEDIAMMEQEIDKFSMDTMARLKMLYDAVDTVALKLGV